MKNVLFVCTGNTCRSPMAEGVFNMEAERADICARAVSCGTAAFSYEPATAEAVEAAKGYGADISGHLSSMVSAELINQADSIYCMTRAQKEALIRRFPDFAGKIETLAEADISDPYMLGPDAYKKAANEIYEAVKRLIGKEGGGK